MQSPLDPWIARRIGQGQAPAPDPAALTRWQAEQLGRALAHARRRSRYFACTLADAVPGDDPARMLAGLPFTTADDLRRHGRDMLTVSQDEVARVVTLETSGTSGPPKRLFFSDQDLADTLEFFRVGLSGFVAPGDPVAILLPGRRPDGATDLLARALADIGAHPHVLPEGAPPDQAMAAVRGLGARCLAALPSQLLALLRREAATGAGPQPARRALLSGEPVPEDLARLAFAAGIELFVHYGLTETGFGGGVECSAHSGYHMREADLYVEIVDPRSARPVDDGEPGEVVLTTLGLRAMPLIRYRTGDWGRLLPGPCPCGSPLRRLGPLAGRVEHAGDDIRVVAPAKGQRSAT